MPNSPKYNYLPFKKLAFYFLHTAEVVVQFFTYFDEIIDIKLSYAKF